MNLTRKKIGDIVNLQQGLCINKKTEYLLSKEGIPLLRITDLINNTKEKFINKDLVQKKFIIDYNDIIYTRTGQVGLVFKNKKGILHNNCFKVWSNKEEVLDEYIYWYLKQKHIIEYVNHVAAGAAQPDLNHDAFKSIDFVFPDKDIQYKIIQILSNYDDLIENNNKRIKILEEMAQIIYKEWFVNFKFPGAKNVTYKDSELGKIPSDWNVDILSSFGNTITGKTPNKNIKENFGNDVPFIKTPDMHSGIFCINTSEKLSAKGANTQKNKLLPIDSICISCIGTVGVVSITTQFSQTNQQINSIIPKNDFLREYLYLTAAFLKPTLQNIGSNGATMTNVNKNKFDNIKILYPNNDILKKFSQLLYPIFEQIKSLSLKNETLKQTRDILLPRLISGEIDVENLEIV